MVDVNKHSGKQQSRGLDLLFPVKQLLTPPSLLSHTDNAEGVSSCLASWYMLGCLISLPSSRVSFQLELLLIYSDYLHYSMRVPLKSKAAGHTPSPAHSAQFSTQIAHTFTCVLGLSHSESHVHHSLTHTHTHADAPRGGKRLRPYTQESGEPVNLLALFEGLRVVE